MKRYDRLNTESLTLCLTFSFLKNYVYIVIFKCCIKVLLLIISKA